MKRITVMSTLVLACAAACWCQVCHDASGQTAAFTLKAGAKSGPTAIRAVAARGRGDSGLRVTTTGSGILVTLPAMERGISDVAVYDIAGRQIYRQRGFSGTSVHFEPQTLAAGIYTVRVQGDAKNYVRRFIVSW